MGFLTEADLVDFGMDTLTAPARKLGLKLVPFTVRESGDFEDILRKATKANVGALLVNGSPLFSGEARFRLGELLLNYRFPAQGYWNYMADAGFLMGYSPNILEMTRSAAIYIDKIFRGAKPADLPVEEPTRYYLVVNLITAKTLKLKIPKSILARADRVIE